MEPLVHALHEALNFLHEGFAHVNAVLGLIIALFAAFQMTSWQKLWEIALAATLVHVIALVLIPVVDHNAPLHLPPLVDIGFWRDTAAVYVGYVLIVAVFFFVRTRLLGGTAAAKSLRRKAGQSRVEIFPRHPCLSSRRHKFSAPWLQQDSKITRGGDKWKSVITAQPRAGRFLMFAALPWH